MQKEILINSTSNEVRAAVMENGNLSEILIERLNKKSVAGNIYKGKVVKVLPGMQSAFVEVGLHRAAFLHVADIYVENADNAFPFLEEEHDLDDENIKHREMSRSAHAIEDLISEGQEIIVQIDKDAIATKGARLTTHLTIPGRYLVLMPCYEHIGISRRIEDEDERDRLKAILTDIKVEGMGLIARTVSEHTSKEDLAADLDYLLRIWRKVSKDIETASAPALIYEDHDLIFKILRDVTTKNVSRIVIDGKNDFSKMQSFMRDYFSNIDAKLEYYENDTPLFDKHNIEIEINRVLDKKVWLRSGGSIVIDQAEALTVIDVNTGKYVGKHNFDDTILKTNLEAAKEIAHQLKIRNIGGIIIVDFIDMERVEDREKVLTLLDQFLKEDRVKASVVNISPLGLVEITRKRVQESVARILSEPCPYCDGRGIIKSKITICYEIMRNVRRVAPESKGSTVCIEASAGVADLLLSYEDESIIDIEKTYGVFVMVKAIDGDTHEHYNIHVFGNGNGKL